MAVLFKNNATTTLSAGIGTGATAITVAAGQGALFPAITAPDFFYATLFDASNNLEIIKVTARTTDTMTIVRAQEGTTARAYATGDKVELRVTAAGLDNKLDKDTGGTLSGPLITSASTSTAAGLRILPGVAPSAPVDGDVWTTSTTMRARLSGATYTLSYNSLTETLTGKSIETTTNTFTVNGNALAAAAGTATFTFPGTTSDTLVALAATQTLTNKTLSGVAITGVSSATADLAVTDTGTISPSSIGFRGIPQNAKTAAYVLALADAGKHISITTGGITVPANASVAFPIGTTIVVYNNSSSVQTIAITTDAMYLAGVGTTGTRNLAGYGLASLVKVGATAWVVSGAGLS